MVFAKNVALLIAQIVELIKQRAPHVPLDIGRKAQHSMNYYIIC